MPELTDNSLKAEVKDYWNRASRDIQIETFATSYDYLPWKSFPSSLVNTALGVLRALTGKRLGLWHGITARKQ